MRSAVAEPPARIAIIGPSGSGKTTLGRWIEGALGLPFTDLDDLHWRPGWKEAPLAEFRAAVDAATRGPRWVLAGNYAKTRDLVWPRAQAIVWLDLPLATALRRSAARALRQWWTREPICNGNRQTLAHIVIGREALLIYTLRTFHARRRDWPGLLAEQSATSAVGTHQLRSPAEIAAWQRRVLAAQAGNTPVDR
jgi:adenylate kinase family enzyme